MPRVHFVKAARTDNAVVKAGESYYWWKFRRGGKRLSKTRPKRSQLTQSEFYSRMYDIEDDVIGAAVADDSLPGVIADVVSQLEELRDEQEEKRQNMPDALQDSDSGNMLQERYDGLDSAISEFEQIDTDDAPTEVADLDEDDREEDETDEDFLARKAEEYWQEKLEEFQNVTIDYP